MKNIGLIISCCQLPAIWNCIKQHLELLSLTSNNLFLYANRDENQKFIERKYSDNFNYYSSIWDLLKKMKNDKIDVIWVPDLLSLFRVTLYSSIYRVPILFWVQGTLPDESYMRNNSLFRKHILSLIETLGFRKATGFIYVSEAMSEYYIPKHGQKNFAIVPCISDFINLPECNRIPNSFVYIGGLSEWQCFEETLLLYKKISTRQSIFHIITFDVARAMDLVRKYLGENPSVQVYCVSDRNKIPSILSQFEYGFLIRKESPVNYVSSPIKFLEYLSCGVNVVMTSAVPSYAEIVKKHKVGTIVDLKSNDITLNPYNPNANKIYELLFNKETFIKRYENLIHNL